jgi:hypothetical protein
LVTERRRQEVELSDRRPRAESSIALGQRLVPPLGEEPSETLSLGIERSASFRSLSLSTVGERLGHELGELLGERLSNDGEKSSTATHLA